jgi:serine-type D-Ala-D-Ala carboxypeptidase (penicillin-binding protein 5/6)
VPALGLVDASGAEKPVPIASLTKMMTAYIVLRDHPIGTDAPGPQVTVTASDETEAQQEAEANDTSIPVQTGEALTERELLDGLLVHSANNFADVLARWDAGTVPAFVQKMNDTAGELDMRDTHYADANGIDSASQSTAADQIRIAAAAMAIPTFATVVAQRAVIVPIGGLLMNYVKQVGTGGIVGVKSGFTQAAMGCLVLAARRNIQGESVLVLAAVTGQPGDDPLEAAAFVAAPLLEVAASHLRIVPVLPGEQTREAGEPDQIEGAGPRGGVEVARVTAPWMSSAVPGVATNSLSALAWPGEVVHRSMTSAGVRGRVPRGATLGTITVRVGTERVSVHVRSTAAVPAPSLTWRLGRM